MGIGCCGLELSAGVVCFLGIPLLSGWIISEICRKSCDSDSSSRFYGPFDWEGIAWV